MRTSIVIAAALLAVVSTGCGGANTESLAKITKALSNPSSGGGNILLNPDVRSRLSDARLMMQIADGDVEAMNALGDVLCPSLESAVQEGCTMACNATKTAFTISCTQAGSSTETCGDATFTLADFTMSMTMDWSGIDMTTVPATGDWGFDLDFSGNVSGEDLDGALACKISLAAPVSADESSTGYNTTPVCGSDYSCSYDGEALPCEDLRSEMEAVPAC